MTRQGTNTEKYFFQKYSFGIKDIHLKNTKLWLENLEKEKLVDNKLVECHEGGLELAFLFLLVFYPKIGRTYVGGIKNVGSINIYEVNNKNKL